MPAYLRRRCHGDRNLRQSPDRVNRRARLYRLLRAVNRAVAHVASLVHVLNAGTAQISSFKNQGQRITEQESDEHKNL